MKIPDIGDTISTKKALKLCRHFEWDISKAFFDGVCLGGGELGFSFSWGFASKTG